MLKHRQGFTIVELLIVIIVIAVLAVITIVAYNGIQSQAAISQLSSVVVQGAKAVQLYSSENGAYPATLSLVNNGQGLLAPSGVTYRYSSTATTFCLTATNNARFVYTTESSSPGEGSCFNVAQGASVTGVGAPALVTDGNLNTNNWTQGTASPTSMAMVDLGSVMVISTVKVWHYYGDGRTYNNPKTEISANGTVWITIYDGATQGTFVETAAGKTISFSPQGVRYIRDQITGNTVNTSNHWVEIQVF